MNKVFCVQAYNNAWANHRLANACAILPAGELTKPRIGVFPSLIATLNHILIVDWFYVSALEGACIGPKAFETDMPFAHLGDYIHAQQEVDQRLITVCNALDGADIERPVTLIRRYGAEVDQFDRVFLHLIQHQIHHRGQVHSMLSDTSVAPPQLDEFYLSSKADQTLRAPDFMEMGLTEGMIWGEP